MRPFAVCSVTRMCGYCVSSALKKTVCGCCRQVRNGWYDRRIRQVHYPSSAGFRIFLEFVLRRVACRHCGTVKRERPDFLAIIRASPNVLPFMSAAAAGRPRSAISPRNSCSTGTPSRRWRCNTCGPARACRHAGSPSIGIDEISVRKGHSYRIVVSDLVRKRPIWFGGVDRSEASMAAVLRLAWSQEEPPNQACRDGHVEAVPQRH